MPLADISDFEAGIAIQDLAEGSIVQGHVDGEDAILVRRGQDYFAVGATCTHYHGALANGLIVDDTIRCPLHHACFSLRTGEALRAPALDPIAAWRVEQVLDKIFVARKLKPAEAVDRAGRRAASLRTPISIVIIGGGAAGLAAADMLRRMEYSGPVTMVSADDTPPYDRPNLSKDFLAGTAPEEWMPLREPHYYADRQIVLALNERVDIDRCDTPCRRSEQRPRNRTTAPFCLRRVRSRFAWKFRRRRARESFTCAPLQTVAQSWRRPASARRAVVVGASFIGLEVAASLRARGIDVHVVGHERVPMERVLGKELGTFVRGLHESHGVSFHLARSVKRVDGKQVTLGRWDDPRGRLRRARCGCTGRPLRSPSRPA